VDLDRGAPGAPSGRGSGSRLGFGQRWALALLTAGVLTVAIEAPAIAAEPFFVGVNTAVVLCLVGLGHYLAAQHGERVTGACFVVAGAGWVVLSLDVHSRWGSLPSWLFGSAIVYTAIGCGILHYGRARLSPAGRWWIVACVAGTTGTTAPIVLVSRPQWLGFSPEAFWPSPWPDRTATTVLVVAACVAWLVVAGLFVVIALRQLRSAPPAQRRILRPLTLAGAGWAGAAAGVTVFATLAPGVVSLHGNSNIIGLLSVSVTAALAAAINRSRVLAATFVDTLPSERTPESLTGYVRGALSDPTAELLFVVPGRDILIDGSGRRRELPDPARADRFALWIPGSAGEPVAVLTGDPLLREDLAAVRSFAKVLAFVAENQQLHAVLRMRLAQLGAVRTAERLAFERAREQFRRDLHDGVQQTIAAARMDLEGIRDDAGASTSISAAIAGLDGKLRLALEQIRSLKQGGPPPELSFGLETAIERTIAELRMDARIRIDPDDLGILTLPVYYLVREALTNTHKHAGPADAEVVVELRSGFVEVAVRDTGAGGATVRPGGGLAGLRDRVVELGGTLDVHSPPDRGTTVRASIPAVPA
jgi:signal transduction histidine kinase